MSPPTKRNGKNGKHAEPVDLASRKAALDALNTEITERRETYAVLIEEIEAAPLDLPPSMNESALFRAGTEAVKRRDAFVQSMRSIISALEFNARIVKMALDAATAKAEQDKRDAERAAERAAERERAQAAEEHARRQKYYPEEK